MPGYCHQLSAQWVRATDDKQVEECSDIGMSHCATIKIPARALAQQTRRRPATRQLRLSTIKSDYTCGISYVSYLKIAALLFLNENLNYASIYAST